MAEKILTASEKRHLAFAAKYGAAALATERKYGVPALVTLAQHIWEGGWENKNPGFNLFGVKAIGGWTGPKQLQKTWEVHSTPNVKYPRIEKVTQLTTGPHAGKYRYECWDWFRKYGSVQEAYEDHAKFLVQNRRYKPAFAVKNDPYAFAKAIAKAGYATDPDYYNKLSGTITQLKKAGLAQPAAPAPSSSPVSSGSTPNPAASK